MKRERWIGCSLSMILSLLVCQAVAIAQSAAPDALAAGFASPPDSARPHTWWHWMNGNVSKQGITLDLESMKRVGIVGAHLAQVGTDIPKGPLAYDSPQLVDCIKFAFTEADRLGMDLCMFNCPGWSSSGGPWVKPENSMKTLVFTETPVAGGKKISVALPQPAAKLDFYRDVYVLAFPASQSPARIPSFNNGMGAPRGGRGRGTVPATAASATTQALDAGIAAIDPAKLLDISSSMDTQGQLSWDAPPGDWIVMRIGFTTIGTQNHPGPDGGVGLEIDKFSREAMDLHFNYFFGKYFEVMQPLAARGKVAALIDSYETGLQNWTDQFPQEFKKRRGYDLVTYMPAMAAGRVVGSVDQSQRFLWDVRKTQAELMDEYYYDHFTELCHQHQMKSFFEPYDNGNFDEMVAGRSADMPMAEFWQGQANQRSVKLVASVMHMNGQPIMGAESFTSQSRWTEYPYSLKALGDFMWTQGLNRFVFHRYAMQPNPTALPGMTMGPWGGHFDRTNTWFEQGKAWLQYAARSQFLLQQGLFVGDVLYFAGEDSPVRNPDESRLDPAPPRGYGYDTIDTATIHQRVKIVDGKITLPDGLAYRLLVLPPTVRTMSLDMVQRIHDLVNQGMCLVVTGPKIEKTPSLSGYPAADATVSQLASELWADLDGAKVKEHAFGKGRVFWGTPLAAVLDELTARPDFEATSRSGNANVNYIHKHTSNAEIYFVANRGQVPEDLVCTFNVAGKRPELWDAASGQMAPAAIYDFSSGRTRMPLQLDPSGSVFIVFRTPADGARHLQAITRDDVVLQGAEPFAKNALAAPTPAGAFNVRAAANPMPLPAATQPSAIEIAPAAGLLAWENGDYALRDEQGRSTPLQVTGIPSPAEVTGPWHVTFPPKLGAPPAIDLDHLISWSEHADPGVKYFSGTATYTARLNVAASGKRLFLDLGRVQVLAEVIVNGKNLGILWKLPFRVDVTDAVHPGDNDLEIRVTNLWPNRLIGDEQLPPENQYAPPRNGRGGGNILEMPDWYVNGLPKPDGGRITFTTWHHWNATEALLESGLIGPVQLRTAVPIVTER